MNWHYITGFFDADGSVTLCTPNKGKQKTIQLSFHNNELSILHSIQAFIKSEFKVKGSISCKRARKPTHQDSYDLKYSYQAGLNIANSIQSCHPKKKHRIAIYNEIQKIIPRNGKYTSELLQKRKALEEKFWEH